MYCSKNSPTERHCPPYSFVTAANLFTSIIALSPDGRRLVYYTPEGLYLRSMGELEAQRIPGT
ncbi:MAG: hypothetical protein O7D97_09865, partial [Planctomycetota bacterium]|nr:hypothetical protein [Planctomycetota bacterium]